MTITSTSTSTTVVGCFTVLGATVPPVRVDFHLHTTWSDGRLSPGELLEEVARGRLERWAITDHDTLGGSRELAGQPGLVPGVELSCWFEGREVHVAGLGVDPDVPELEAFLVEIRGARRARLAAVIEQVNRARPGALDPAILDVPDGRVVTRYHLASALLAAGTVPRPAAAYDELIGDEALADLPPPAYPDPGAAAAAVRTAGGVAILAHPGQLGDIGLVERLMATGLDGLERRHPRLPRGLRSLLDRAARKHGWLGSCGSDAHASLAPRRLGDWHLKRDALAPLLSRL